MPFSYTMIETPEEPGNNYIEALKKYLIKNPNYLWDGNNQMVSWDYFCGRNEKSDRDHILMPGELFLCDLVCGQLWIGRMKRRGYVKVALISEDMKKDYGNYYNGYAKLPKLSVKKVKINTGEHGK